MYFSFTSMPGVKQLNIRERVALLRNVNKLARTDAKYFFLVIVSFVGGMMMAGVLQRAGLHGSALAYLIVATMLVIWVAGSVYILNKHVYPKVLELNMK